MTSEASAGRRIMRRVEVADYDYHEYCALILPKILYIYR